jgi:hypothetical protein
MRRRRHQQVKSPRSSSSGKVAASFDKGVQMPGTFDEREKGYEAKWVHDQEMRFKVYSRRNRLLGAWAAAEAGLKGAEAEGIVREVVAAEFDKGGDEAVFAKIRRVFDDRKVVQSDHMIRRKMDELLDSAKAEIENEMKR